MPQITMWQIESMNIDWILAVIPSNLITPLITPLIIPGWMEYPQIEKLSTNIISVLFGISKA